MTLAEPFNFSKNLTAIVRLKEYGFSKKGQVFTRERRPGLDEIIAFQRSQFNTNIPGFPFKFFLNCTTSVKVFDTFIRLGKPSNLQIPDYYEQYLQSPLENRPSPKDVFTEVQLAVIDQFNKSSQWSYSTEDELIELLHLSLEAIKSKGFWCFDAISNLLQEDLGPQQYRMRQSELHKRLSEM
jgi:hypothetical protein